MGFILCKTQVPVVPVYCGGAFDLMPRRSWSPRPGTVRLMVGNPISTAGMTYDEITRKLYSEVAGLLK